MGLAGDRQTPDAGDRPENDPSEVVPRGGHRCDLQAVSRLLPRRSYLDTFALESGGARCFPTSKPFGN